MFAEQDYPRPDGTTEMKIRSVPWRLKQVSYKRSFNKSYVFKPDSEFHSVEQMSLGDKQAGFLRSALKSPSQTSTDM